MRRSKPASQEGSRLLSRPEAKAKSESLVVRAQTDHAGTREGGNFAAPQADLGEDFGRLGAEPLWCEPHVARLAVVENGMVDQRQRRPRAAGAVDLKQGTHVMDLGILGDFGIAADRSMPDFAW